MSAETDIAAREVLIAALASGASIADAARASGYSYRQAHRLAHDPGVLASVDERKNLLVSDPGGRTEDAAIGRAVLREIAKDKTSPPAARVAAARALVAIDTPRSKTKAAEKPDGRLEGSRTPPDEGTVLKLLG